MNEQNVIKPPYLSHTTFKNFLASLKNGVIPARIDKSLMVGQSGATQSYLMSSLRFFGLIDMSGAPEPELKALVTSEGDERKKIWKPIFERSYSSTIGDLNLETATVGMLHEKFAAQELTGQTVKKCHSFFAAAAEEAGISLPPQLKPNTRGGGKRGRRKANAGRASSSLPEDEFSKTDAINNGSSGSGEAGQFSTLLLDGAGKRILRIKGPATITKAELQRIQQWLSFQFIVEDEE